MGNRSGIYLVPFLAVVLLLASVDRVYAVAGLRVKSDIEGAELFLNGKRWDIAPLANLPLTPGVISLN